LSDPKKGGCRRWLAGGLIGVFVLTASVAIVLWFRVNSYLGSESFRGIVNGKINTLLRMEGCLMPLRWDGGMIFSDGFKGQEPSGRVMLRADQLRARINLQRLWSRVLQLDELAIHHLELVSSDEGSLSPAEAPASFPSAGSDADRGEAPFFRGFGLKVVEIENVNLSHSGADGTVLAIREMHGRVTPERGAVVIEGHDGRIQWNRWKDLRIESLKARWQDSRLSITEGQFRFPEGGMVKISGEVDLAGKGRLDLQVEFSDVPAMEIVPYDWRARLKGKLHGNVRVAGSLQSAASRAVRGTIRLQDGSLEALPVLDQIAAYARTERFRRLAVQSASADFEFANRDWTVSRFLLESTGLLNVEGRFATRDGKVEGRFQVGIATATLQWLPSAVARVFSDPRGGYVWTTMTIGGAINRPSEDLSPRLVAATQTEMVEGVVRKAGQTLNGLVDLVKPLIP
jgi:hypothetical protein